MHTLDFFTENPWLFLIIMLVIFGAIVVGVILVKKYSPHFKNTEKPKSDAEIAEEEVARLTQPVEDEPKTKKTKEEEPVKKEVAPSSGEAATYESHRATEDSEDVSFQKQMDEYAKSHPEEEDRASSNATNDKK